MNPLNLPISGQSTMHLQFLHTAITAIKEEWAAKITLFTMSVTAEYMKSQKVGGAFGMSSWRNHCVPSLADNAAILELF